jgi:signal transduction histidine kinase
MGLLLALLCALPWTMPAGAATAAAGDGQRVSLAGRLDHFVDLNDALSFDTIAQPAFVRTHFARLPDFRSLGYDTHTHWFHAELDPDGTRPARQVLAIGSPELEEVDVWVQRRDGSFRHEALGYHRPYQNRPLGTRLFALPIDTFPGMQLYFRVRTNNALVVHAELAPADMFTGDETRGNFIHGLYFGILLIVTVLYAILGTRLRDMVMATYAGYVASQLLFHLGTTGYLPVLLSGASPWAVDTLPRLGWLGSAVSLVLMWDRLLDLKHTRPRTHALYLGTLWLHLGLLPMVLLPSLVTRTGLMFVALANYAAILCFALAMGMLFRRWRASGQVTWLIYLIAFAIPSLGTAINTATNHGALPWNVITGYFYQTAALVHVLVMSYGLALRLRQLQQDKTAVERENAIVTQRAQEQRQFVALLSHEFGNPLAAIDRAAQMIQLNTSGLDAKDSRRLALIRNNAAILAGFVDRFLMTEAMDNGALVLSRTPYRIRQLLDDTLTQQDPAARARIQIRHCAAGTFEMDATLIGAAVGNLLTNALRYSPPDSMVELSAIRDADGLRMRVADHGPGLGADELAQLGTLYFRGKTGLGKKGSGLGYHFTRRIIEAHGGTLNATSPVGTGLMVEMFLPV